MMEKANQLGIAVVICVRDRHDNLVAHIRMKGALLGSVDLACQKVSTALTTGSVAELWSAGPQLSPLPLPLLRLLPAAGHRAQ